MMPSTALGLRPAVVAGLVLAIATDVVWPTPTRATGTPQGKPAVVPVHDPSTGSSGFRNPLMTPVLSLAHPATFSRVAPPVHPDWLLEPRPSFDCHRPEVYHQVETLPGVPAVSIWKHGRLRSGVAGKASTFGSCGKRPTGGSGQLGTMR